MAKLPEKLRPFASHGTKFMGVSGDQHYGNCSICLDSRHFYVSEKTGQWDCKKCGESGNIYDFLKIILENALESTTKEDYQRLSKLRDGIPASAFRRFRCAWDGVHWLIPHTNENGTVLDIRRWTPGTKQLLSTAGCKAQLFGLNRRKKDKGKAWLCEGEWDAMALKDLLIRAGIEDDWVTGVPGADVFKDSWVGHFKRRHVNLCYDADDAGDRGSKKTAAKLLTVTRHIHYLCWPDSRPNGYDIRDFLTECRREQRESDEILNALELLIQDKHRRMERPISDPNQTDDEDDGEMPERPPFEVLPREERPTFDQVVETFAKWIEVNDDFKLALRYALCIVASEQFDGHPLWGWLVGASSGGKSVIINSLQTSDQVIIRSTITSKSLVSGYQLGELDPSLFAILHARTLCVPDASELVADLQGKKDKTLSTLRGIYDGSGSWSYGNNIHRHYRVHFSMLLGTTSVINAFSDASLGERFLKFHLARSDVDEERRRMDLAIEQVGYEVKMEQELKDAVRRFLAFEIKEVPSPKKQPTWIRKRIKPLVQLVCRMRATVNRKYDWRVDSEVTHRPEPEEGGRLVKQLWRLLITSAAIDGRTVADTNDYLLIERVACDTMIEFHFDIVQAIRNLGENATESEIAKTVNIPGTTLQRRLEDMLSIELIEKKKREKEWHAHGKSGRRAESYYVISPIMERLISEAKLGQLPKLIPVRRKKS